MDNADLIKKAKKKVKDKKEFYAHLYSFCAVSSVLFVINFFTSPGGWWFVLPIVGWGMAVVGHYLRVFGLPSRDRAWEEAQFEIELDKLEREQSLGNQKEGTLDISDDELELRALKEKQINYNPEDLV